MHMPAQKHVPYPVEEHSTRVACADPAALAYEWIVAYLDNLNSRINTETVIHDEGTPDEWTEEPDGDEITLDELIQVGMSFLGDSGYWSGDYISRGGAFEGESTDPVFWDKLAALKGIEIPEKNRGNFFSCAC